MTTEVTTGPIVGTSWHSYPQIFNLGHAAVRNIFIAPVVVQEKVDGSQFSFGVFDGKLRVKSKGKEMDPDAPEKLFARAVETVKDRVYDLHDGWTYRGEVLDKPKHNVLAYDRVPNGHIVLFDINDGEESYLCDGKVAEEGRRLGLETVPTFPEERVDGDEQLRGYLERESFLGGQKVEGVVIKSLSLFGTDKKRLMAKFVSEAFKESHKKVWGENSKARADILDRIVATHKTDARWRKAVIHLRERGEIADSPRDIPALIRETQEDLWSGGEGGEIAVALVEHFKRDINRRITAGIAEWYKALLLEKQFEEQTDASR